MNIKLSIPDLLFDKRIEAIAIEAGCYARIRWNTANEVRFILVDQPMSMVPATFEQHDQVIGELLALDPLAKVRTAKAVYHGLAEFEAARV